MYGEKIRTPNGRAISEFERERAECGALSARYEILQQTSEDTFNASEQDNLATRAILKRAIWALFLWQD